jgi:DNA-binding CsgD family transcriptional regulator
VPRHRPRAQPRRAARIRHLVVRGPELAAGPPRRSSGQAQLTPREREVAARLLEGLTSKEIGKALEISHRTVEIYRARLMRKYAAATTAELVQKLMAG